MMSIGVIIFSCITTALNQDHGIHCNKGKKTLKIVNNMYVIHIPFFDI